MIGVRPYSVQTRDIGFRQVIDGPDGALLQGDADQQRNHGLRHGEGCQAIRIGATVLVTLDQNRIVFRDQQAGDRLTIEVVVERQVEPGEAIANDGFARCASQWD